MAYAKPNLATPPRHARELPQLWSCSLTARAYGCVLQQPSLSPVIPRRAQRLADQLNSDFPLATPIQGYWLPTIWAIVELGHSNAAKALELLQATSSYELGNPRTLLPVYVRGQAYLAARSGPAPPQNFKNSSTIAASCRTRPWAR
jgi:hypothetical protein